MKALRISLQILLPLLLILGGAKLAQKIVAQQQQPPIAPAPFAEPLVRTVVATSGDVRTDVATQGTVEPYRAIALAAEVRGRVVAVSPNLRAGGFFAAGEELVTIDRADYELAVATAEAAIARAELRVAQEKAEAEAAVRAWRQLEGEREAGPLVTREAQQREAAADLAAAQAQHERARLDLERTTVRAPYPGRVRSADVDLGQFVQPGQTLAHVYGTAAAEIRLPIQAADVAFLDLPLHANAPASTTPSTSRSTSAAPRLRHAVASSCAPKARSTARPASSRSSPASKNPTRATSSPIGRRSPSAPSRRRRSKAGCSAARSRSRARRCGPTTSSG
ncbi:MAG: HlyD family efflux transporter periplasmic adaptor subunit [Planctomycetota bacterium]